MQSLCESLMSELDFDFTPFLEETTSTISSATTESVVFTALVQSLSTSLEMFPSGGCLPGISSHASEMNTHHYQPQALPLHNTLSGGGCLSGLANVGTSVVPTSTSNPQPEMMQRNATFTREIANLQSTFKSPEQVFHLFSCSMTYEYPPCLLYTLFINNPQTIRCTLYPYLGGVKWVVALYVPSLHPLFIALLICFNAG